MLLGFILGLNDKINNNKKLKLALFILTTIILSGISISINFIPSKYLKRKPSFIFSIVYIFCITIISFLFSDYINSKAILSSLGLIILDAISMEIYALIIYCYKPNNEQKQFSFNIYGYLLSPFISNILVIIILHFCLIKNGFDTLYLSIAGLFFILSHFILMHLLNKFYKKKGYIFHSLIISLSIYSILGFIIKKCYKYIKPTFEQYHGVNIKPFLFKIYSILLIEFFFIWLTIFLFFHFELNIYFVNHKEIIFSSVTIVVYIMLIIFFQERVLIIFLYLFYFISIIIILIYGLLLSSIFDTNLILSFFTLILLDIFSIEIYILFYKEYNKWGMVLAPIIINVISVPLLYFFMVKNINVLYIFLIFAVVIILLNLLIHTLLFVYLKIDYNNKTILTIMLIKLSLIAFLYSIIECFDNTNNNNDDDNENNNNDNNNDDDIKKKDYLSKVNIQILIFIIIFIFLFYIYNAKGVIKYADNILPFIFFYIAGIGTPTIYTYKIIFQKEHYERVDRKYLFMILNIFYLLPNLYISIILFNIYNVIYILWIVLFTLLTMIIYTLISKKFNYFLFILHPLITYLIVYYIIKSFWLTDESSTLLILISAGYIVYIMIIEIVILIKANIKYDEIFYTVTLIIYLKYFLYGLYMDILYIECYYLIIRCFLSDESRRKFHSFICFCKKY